ncbi:hypothetical protein C5167_039875, partial [Papaver somniferum]
SEKKRLSIIGGFACFVKIGLKFQKVKMSPSSTKQRRGGRKRKGESRAVLEGLRWAKAMDLDSIHIISDAEAVVNSINNISFSIRWENRKIMQEIKHLLTSFIFTKVSYVSRNFNSSADSISKVVRRDKLQVEEFSHDVTHLQTILSWY